jgi:hypothetical protein
MTLRSEAAKLQRLLRGKAIARVRRLGAKELLLEFADGTRLHVDHQPDRLEFSITDGPKATLKPRRAP